MSSKPNSMRAEGADSPASTLALAWVLTWAAAAIPAWQFPLYLWQVTLQMGPPANYGVFHDSVAVLLGLTLALSAPRRSGLQLGDLQGQGRRLFLVCGAPILVCAVVYPMLGEQPFADEAWSMWTISPLAQDLLFIGYLYGRLQATFPGKTWGFSHALLWTCLFFSLWHMPNLASDMSLSFLGLQILYTFLGLLVVGLSRQWTGSILFAVLTHCAVNFIAWW